MNNARFYWLLAEPKDARGKRLWTVERVAAAICSSRAHVTEVLNNKPGRGHQTRKKLVRFFKAMPRCPEMLEALGWDEEGNVVGRGSVPHGKCDVERSA